LKQRKLHIVYLLFILASLFIETVHAQNVLAGVDRNKIVIGEQIKLVVAVENANSIRGWFNLPDSANHIEVVERKEIDTINIGNIVNYRQEIIITSFDSGRWQIPPITIEGAARSTQPITIDVLPVDVSHMQDYHDVKDIEQVELRTPWYIYAALIIVLLASVAIIYWLYKKKKTQVVAPPVIKGSQTPFQWALQELSQLQEQQLYLHKQVKQHYSRITDIARSFFYMQLQHPSLHSTTDEWMVHLQSVPADQQLKTSFLQMLRLAETVKFAKYVPPHEDSEVAITTTRDFIKNVAAAEANAAYQPKTM
jgi:hypothetical protein